MENRVGEEWFLFPPTSLFIVAAGFGGCTPCTFQSCPFRVLKERERRAVLHAVLPQSFSILRRQKVGMACMGARRVASNLQNSSTPKARNGVLWCTPCACVEAVPLEIFMGCTACSPSAAPTPTSTSFLELQMLYTPRPWLHGQITYLHNTCR